jgi:hypothetical protein
MNISVKRISAALTLSMVSVFAHVGGGYSQQSILGAEFESYIAEVDGRETWYSMSVDSKQVGYFFDKIYRTSEDNQEFIVYQFTSVDADTDGVEIRVTTAKNNIFFDATTGLPTKCTYEKTDSKGSVLTTKLARREKDKWIVSETGADTKTVTNQSANFDAGKFFADIIWMKNQQEQGAKFLASEFDCETLAMTDMELEFLREEKRVLRGARVAVKIFGYELNDEAEDIHVKGQLESLKDGTFLSMQLGKLEISLKPKELVVGGKLIGIQSAFNLTISEHIEDYSRLSSLKVELSGEGFEESNVSSYRQTLIAENSKSLVFELGETGQQGIIASETEIKRFLKPKNNSETAENKISEILRTLKIAHKSDDEKIRTLLAFVSPFLEDDYFSDANDVLKIINDRKGDCTEHATLYVALARAAGIPAREVEGYIYGNEEGNPIFVAHAWVEVVLDGKWIGVDPSWGEARISPIHVKVGSMTDMVRVAKIKVLEKKYIDELPKSEMEAAELAFKNENYINAKMLFLKMSRQENPIANYYLGAIHEFGLGVENDLSKAAHYYRMSAARGDIDAKSKLAVLFAQKDSPLYEPISSVFWHEKAAKGGSAKDALLLAQLYEGGVGIPKNSRQAYEWYKYAAEIAVDELETD